MKIDLEAIIQIESGGNPKAFNESSGAIGLCQINRICLEDYNRNNREGIFITAQGLFDGESNKIVAEWYLNTRIPKMLKSYGLLVNLDNILIAYNWGIGNLIKLRRGEAGKTLPKETVNYLKKYKELVS